MGINNVTLSGNLTKDPELRKTNNDKEVVSFTLAINEGKDKVEFVNCVAWEKTAELIAAYSRKGQKLVVVGRLQTRSWEAEGVTKYKTEAVVYRIDLPAKTEPEFHSQEPQQAPAAQPVDDEIPF